jgi:hypothetical protein
MDVHKVKVQFCLVHTTNKAMRSINVELSLQKKSKV